MKPENWFPPNLSDEEIQEYLDEYPDDPHAAAAAAWEDYAASLPLPDGGITAEGVESISTGAQSVRFGKNGGGQLGAALDKADWHRARAKVKTPQYGPQYETTWPKTNTALHYPYPETGPCWEGNPPS